MSVTSEIEIDLAPTPEAHETASVEELLETLVNVVAGARPVPLGTSVMVSRDEVVELAQGALAQLPEELRAARRLLRDREAFLASVQREGDEIVAAAREQAERMVARTEVVKSAEARARRTVEVAETEARTMRHSAEDWADERLGALEGTLDKAVQAVRAGRARLVGTAPVEHVAASDEDPGPFDQDTRES